jgi:hypothetical protein
MKENESRRHSRTAATGLEIVPLFKITAAAPVLSTLSEFSRCVESELLFLDRNTPAVAELKHVAERDDC